MTDATLVDPRPDVVVGARRSEVLGRLREADGPLSVRQVASQTGLHVNTARFHLDGLVGDGLAERTAEVRDLPGRPRILYSARPAPQGRRSYGLLAEMLTGIVATLDDTRSVVMDTGRAWGRHLVDRAMPSQQVEADEALARLDRVLDSIGFQPEVRPGSDDIEIRLHHCPFREVAERHSDVICTMHLGLMQGVVAELRAPLDVHSLEPRITPDQCVARIRPVRRPQP